MNNPITLYVNASRRLVDESGKPLGVGLRPEFVPGVIYDVDVVLVSGAPDGVYTMSADIRHRRGSCPVENLMMQSETATVANGVIQFRGISTDTLGFWNKPRQTGERLFMDITMATEAGEVPICEDFIFCRPGIAGSGTHPAPNPGAVTKINTLTGAIELVDADGNALPTLPGNKIQVPATGGGSGVTVIADPMADLPVIDATWGRVRYLDVTYPRIAFSGRIRNLRRVRLELVSADPAASGNIVIVPVVNGVDGSPVVIPVGATLAEAVFPLEFVSASLTLRRDYNSPDDTLQDGGEPITAIVTGTVLEVHYDA